MLNKVMKLTEIEFRVWLVLAAAIYNGVTFTGLFLRKMLQGAF